MKTLSTLIVAVSLLAGSSIASAVPVNQKDVVITAIAVPPVAGMQKNPAAQVRRHITAMASPPMSSMQRTPAPQVRRQMIASAIPPVDAMRKTPESKQRVPRIAFDNYA